MYCKNTQYSMVDECLRVLLLITDQTCMPEYVEQYIIIVINVYYIIPRNIQVVQLVDYGQVILNRKFHLPRVQQHEYYCTLQIAIVPLLLHSMLSIKPIRELAISLFFWVSEDDICELIEDSDAENTKKRIRYAVSRMNSFAVCADDTCF